jgi:erythromycin esterase-like protein
MPATRCACGFYGLDLYSLHASMKARARERYACFDQFDQDTRIYGFMTRLNLSRSCEDDVINQLVELRRRQRRLARPGDRAATEDYFYANQNALLVKNPEAYYRSMFLKEVSSWNLRDRHMTEKLDAIVEHLQRHGKAPRSRYGSTIPTSAMRARPRWSQRSELNLGQLMRERYGHDAVLVGFTTYHGTVTAASD